MPLRELSLPNDLEPLGDVIAEAFQYPDHPEWSVQTDEIESFVASLKNFRRMWPVIQLLLWVSPVLRDMLRGYTWKEDGRIVGLVNFGRRGTTDVWYVANVGVLPGYRRRGIARQLVSASLETIRERGGRTALLDVIDGNYPAYKLYQSQRFEVYTSSLMLELKPQAAPAPPPLPAGYVQEVVSLFEWRSRYALAQRITPEHVLTYEPVNERRYRIPPAARLMIPLTLIANGLKVECSVVRTPTEVVACARSEARVRQEGRNEIQVSLDPAHAELAPYLIRSLLHRVTSRSPGRIVEMGLPEHQSALIDAAQGAGFVQRTLHRRMGIHLLA